MRPTLLLMLKAPEAGRVKTRLGREIGAEAACVAYQRLVAFLAGRIEGFSIEVHGDPPNDVARLQSWWETLVAQPEKPNRKAGGHAHSATAFFPQSNGDLGDRMAAAVSGALQRGATGVILLGADCPAVDTALLEQAADALKYSDVVIGPARDGGYYLLGLKAGHRVLFDTIPWSTADVFSSTLAAAKRADLSVHTLPEQEDVDDLASWERAQARFPNL